MILNASAFFNFPHVKYFFHSPFFGQVRIKIVELPINEAPVCCKRFGGSS